MYKLDPMWPGHPSVFTGPVYSAAVDDKNGEIYVSQRGDLNSPVLVFNTSGALLRSFVYDTVVINMVHGMRVHYNASSGKSRLWLTDVGDGQLGYTVKKFSPDGEFLEYVLGTPGKKGNGLSPVQFDQVADIAISDEGDMFIVDGDGGMNNRLLKLQKDFKVEWHVGINGSKPGQFHIPHSVELDGVGRVWVADRMNGRLQAFNANNGSYLGEWSSSCFTDGQPYSVRLSADQTHFIVTQLQSDRILFVASPRQPGTIGNCTIMDSIQLVSGSHPHLVAVSQLEGAFYVGEIGSKTCQKYLRVT